MDRTIRVWSVKAVKDAPKKEEKKDDTKDAKDEKKDSKDKKDAKKDAKKEEKKEEKIDPKDAGEVKRLGPTTDDPYAIAWSDKTNTLAVCGYSGQVTTWALDETKPKFTRAIKNPGYCIVFTADGKGVFTGHDNGTVAFTPLTGK
jgi:WD40 repeat protein